MPKNVRLSLEAADGTRVQNFPSGTVAGPFRYSIKTEAGADVAQAETDQLFADFPAVPDGRYVGLASRLDQGGNQLAGSEVSVTFEIVDEGVNIVVPGALAVTLS